MSKYTRQLKAKYGAKRLLPATKPICGLPADPNAVIAVADAPDRLVFADVDTGQEWALPKTSLSDICTIRTAHLKEMMNDPSRRGDSAAKTLEFITSAISLDFGDILRSVAASLSDCCLVLTYVQGGANELMILHVGSEKSNVCDSIVDNVVQNYGSRFREALPVSDTAQELAQKYPYMSSASCGVACGVLCEALVEDGLIETLPGPEPEPEPVRSRFCGACGTELDDGDRFCPQCGTPRRA